MLAKVARLCTIVGHVPVYAKLTRSVQELLEAIHKFQKGFNEKVRQLVTQLKATKGCMKAAQIRSHTHIALTELTQSQEVHRRFYWPELPGMLENPNWHYFRFLQVALKGSGLNMKRVNRAENNNTWD